ncbi:hypothetical protein GCM10009641_54940 [Mycobacterium cookii]|uniref:Uncharacterized protein n=1 Tax=Mycobacterium cookii TaxID=1775 RepID=A0A7I7KRX3_9MYCO|nr:hypothetical protein MCOO_05290 [Mycobacterium cookii]
MLALRKIAGQRRALCSTIPGDLQSVDVARPATMHAALRRAEEPGHQTRPATMHAALRRAEEPGHQTPPGDDARRTAQLCQYSMMRVSVGVIPDFRTALTVTLPALPEASSIWPLPR